MQSQVTKVEPQASRKPSHDKAAYVTPPAAGIPMVLPAARLD